MVDKVIYSYTVEIEIDKNKKYTEKEIKELIKERVKEMEKGLFEIAEKEEMKKEGKK